MSETRFGVNDAMAVKLHSKKLVVEVPRYTDITPLIGSDANSIIQRKTETSKGPGDSVTFGLRAQLSQDGFTETDTAEGRGEGLSIYSDSVVINELGGNVAVRSKNTIDAQRVPFDMREEAMDGLGDWWGVRTSVSFFNQVCGYTVQTDTRYTGLQATVAPDRKVYPGSATTDQGVTSSDKFTLDLIDKAVEAARNPTTSGVMPMRPVNVGSGKKMFVCYLHDYQVTDLRTNTSTGQWLDIQKAAMEGGKITSNPIFGGALGVYNDVVLRSSPHVTQGVNSSSGAAITTVRRAVLLGAQAAAVAYGQKNSPARFRWNEELFDHKRRLEVSAWSIWGMKKTRFNSKDFSTIVIPTYAAAHHS
jgi:N4-gp56 family major capsid protein